jgi:acetylornithine deacetylase
MFEAHQDTVPTDGMTIDPWKPEVRDGRLYGRGSCDIKGGMTAMLSAAARLSAERPARRPTLSIACTINEEFGYSGASDLPKLWQAPGTSILVRRPDAAVVAEPTRLDVVVAHKGAIRWRIHTKGRAAHSSQPHLGENAVFKMARVLLALEAYQKEVAPAIKPHPLCGRVTLSVGIIRGGLSVNTVPDRCTIEVDRRLLPGEDELAAYRQVVDHIEAFPGVDFEVEHDVQFMKGSSLSDGENRPLGELLSATARRLTGRGQIIGVPFGTDASRTSAAGIPSVVFGPGSIDQAHTADEWLPLDELEQASDVLYQFVLDYGE